MIGSLLRPAPLPAGSPAPELSLTAHDGTWARSEDHLGRAPLALVFLRDPEGSGDALRALEAARPRLEAMGAKLFAISHARLDRLRAAHAAHGLNFLLLYDLLAMTSRAWGQSGRRPYVRDGFAVIGPDGLVAAHVSGPVDAAALVEAVSRVAGVTADDPGRSETQVPQKRDVEARDVEWARVDAMLADSTAPYVLVDVRTPDEFDALRHPRARNIPVEELPNRINELPARARVLCVCQTGGRATATVGFLVSAGFTEVYNVKGGMAIWPGSKG